MRVVSCELVFSHILRVASCELVFHHINSFYTFVLILDSAKVSYEFFEDTSLMLLSVQGALVEPSRYLARFLSNGEILFVVSDRIIAPTPKPHSLSMTSAKP